MTTHSAAGCGPAVRDPNPLASLSGGVDPRFLRESGMDVYNGNELLIKGALEAGVSLITGYPGSPVSEAFDVLHTLAPHLARLGVVGQIANNEALATSRLNGARQAGMRAMAIMKSVGFHVGADALATGNLMETKHKEGGTVVVVGDDPWNETTQINSDSRYLSKHLHMPILMPADFQEIKDWIKAAFDLSGHSDLSVTYLLTTNQADGGGTVETSPNIKPAVSRIHQTTLDSSKIHLDESVMIPPHTSLREATLADRQERLLQRSRVLKLNRLINFPGRRVPLGIVTAGLPYSFLQDVLSTLGLQSSIPILKLGLVYPLDAEGIFQMASKVDHMIVIEEKRGFVEEQIAELLIHFKQEGRLPKVPALWGKQFPDGYQGIPSAKGVNASVLLKTFGPIFKRWSPVFPDLQLDKLEQEMNVLSDVEKKAEPIPARIPTFCPGCPHRDSAVVSKKLKEHFVRFDYMKTKSSPATDVIFHGESGCHSMLQFKPFEGLMQNYSGMGLGGGTGAGMSPFVSNKQVVFLGDSTFFHSGILAISDSIKNNQDITYIILQNDTTAMTGHQPTPGNDRDIMGNPTAKQDIEKILSSMFAPTLSLVRLNPADRERYQDILEDIVARPGVKVVIADKECAITYQRKRRAALAAEKKEKGFIEFEEKINITPDVCEFCLECTRQTGCPGLTLEETVYGPKIATDLSLCVDDGACARTKACPSFEKVSIHRRQAPRKPSSAWVFDTAPPDPIRLPWNGRLNIYTAGVGGMGAGVINAVLVRAGLMNGFKVQFLDKKGLAIRNGAVYGHVVFSDKDTEFSPVIPYGKADVLLGLDLLESARAADPGASLKIAHPSRTRAVVNLHKNETVLSLIGNDKLNVEELENRVKDRTLPHGLIFRDFSSLSERLLGSKLYANLMVVGAAYQMGYLPFEEKVLLDALEKTVRPSELAANKSAFNMGRWAVIRNDLASNPKPLSLWDQIEKKADYLRRDSFLFGARNARFYRHVMTLVDRWVYVPKETKLKLAHTVYDLIRYESPSYAQTYLNYVWSTYRRDNPKFGHEATQAVIDNLYKVMAIKDEVWVAKLLTSPEKYERDRIRYRIDPSQGDTIRYTHLNRPRFPILGWTLEFDIQTKDWMLRWMAKAPFLRRVLPAWHKEEKQFRLLYRSWVEKFTYFDSRTHYDRFVEILKLPENVKGYREIRFGPMAEARKKAASLFLDIPEAIRTERVQPIDVLKGK